MSETTNSTDATPTTAKRSFISRILTPVLALVAAVGVGIFGGVLIGQNTAAASAPTGFTPPANMSEGATMIGGDLTSGTITSIDGDAITVTLDDGSTVTVTASDDTTVTVDATVDDLATGDTVTVFGEKDDDGNVAADSISEGDDFGGGRPASDG